MAYLVAGHDYGTRYAYDQFRAIRAGYQSVRAYKADTHAARAVASLSRPERQAYDRSLDALSLLRRDPFLSPSQAAKEAGTTVATMRRHLGDALQKVGNRYEASSSDRLARPMRILTEHGWERAIITNSADASTLGHYAHAVNKYKVTGDASFLDDFAGKSIKVKGKQVQLITDPAILDRLTRSGEIELPDDDLYERDFRS